jgi:phage gp45-like
MVLNILKKALITLDRVLRNGQCQYMDTISDYTAIYPYGMYAKAKSGSMTLLMSLNKDESHKVGLEYDLKKLSAVFDDMESGEVAFFHPGQESFLVFKNNGDINIDCKNDVNLDVSNDSKISSGNNHEIDAVTKIKLTAPTVEIVGNVTVAGNITATGIIQGGTVQAGGGGLVAAQAVINGKNVDGHQHGAGTYQDSVPAPVTGNSGAF